MSSAALAAQSPVTLTLTRDLLYEIASDSQDKRQEDLQKTTLGLNASLPAFHIARSGDDITLTFGIQLGSARGEFRLFGNKHDYYRMAMGAELSETFRAIAKADPTIEPVEARMDDGKIILSLRYTWPRGAEPAGPPAAAPAPTQPSVISAQKRPKEAAADDPASTRTGRRERSIVQPPSDVEPERNPRYFVPAKPTPFDEASDMRLSEAPRRPAEGKPEARQASEAGDRDGALREQQAYEQALTADSEEAYRSFLEKFPASSRSAEIEARLKAVRTEKERADAEGGARAATDRRRRETYEQARKLNDSVAYRVFLAAYPDSPEEPEITRLLRDAESDDDAFTKASGSAKGLQGYLTAHPNGRHSEEARKSLEAMKDPSAEKALPVPTLVVPRVASAPVIDGRARDGVWQAAQSLDIPVVQGTTPRVVRVRAIHDSKNIYLTAQWRDPTKDTLYRPWVWGGAKKTYRQSDQIDDGFAVALYRGKAPVDSCMLHGQEQETDLWIWRAFWSEISGYAIDEAFRVSRERIPKANPYPSESGSGQLWARQDPDAGAAPWRLVVPLEYRGNMVPSYERATPSGSRADVRAAANWESGTWTVEFSRALDTKHPDDTSIKEKGTTLVSFAVFEKSEKSHHASTGLVRLEVRGR